MKIIPYKLCPSALSSYFIEQFNQPRRLKTQTVLSYNQCNSIAQIILWYFTDVDVNYPTFKQVKNAAKILRKCKCTHVCVRFTSRKIILGRFSDSQLDVGWFIPTRVLTWLRWLEAWPELLPWSKFSVPQTLIEALMESLIMDLTIFLLIKFISEIGQELCVKNNNVEN